ncbi:MAG: glucose-1-phosphate cytidylyltransferase [Gemmatimonadota bacterium]|nr:glucose-1-phosphate cytidylyltransferase [Gemmatimonadota bacterium]
MKVVILCGGTGARLAGAPSDLPKPMVPVGGRPIVWHIMHGFARSGYRDFVLCLGHRSDAFKQYFLNLPTMLSDVTIDLGAPGSAPLLHRAGGETDWSVTLAETGHLSMTAYRVRSAAKYLPEDDAHFAVTYGDGVTDLDFRRVVEFHRAHGRLATVTAVRPPARFGELTMNDDGIVREFNEKPQASGGWISGGFFVFSREFVDRLPDDPTVMLEREPLQQLASEGHLMAYRHSGFWYCMDTPRDHAALEEYWSSGSAPWMNGSASG